jgi:4-hydroxyphenylpyruvate dioxygenase
MQTNILNDYSLDYVEIITPMAKPLAYWHTHALGFGMTAYADADTGKPGSSSYLVSSGRIRLLLTSAYPMGKTAADEDVTAFIARNYCGIKRFALRVDSVQETFDKAIAGGAFPVKFPTVLEDNSGRIEEAAIRLYDDREILFINRDDYNGAFKPGYKPASPAKQKDAGLLLSVDHIAAEVRMNESHYWTDYLSRAIGTSLVQSIRSGEDNKTGMTLNINQSFDKELTLVIAEPETYKKASRIQRNVDTFGSGIHHLAFTTNDMSEALRMFRENDVEFVNFPPSYYELLRGNDDFRGVNIDDLEAHGILIDKEDDSYLLQKFIKPISDRPFFFYEIVQRVNGYNGFALKNINMLKRAEEMEIAKI